MSPSCSSRFTNKYRCLVFGYLAIALLVFSVETGCRSEEEKPSGEEAIQNAEKRKGGRGTGSIPWPPIPANGAEVATEFVRFVESPRGLSWAWVRIFNFSDKTVDGVLMQLHCVDQKKVCLGGSADGSNCKSDDDCPQDKKGGSTECKEQFLPCPGDGANPDEWWKASKLEISAQSHNLYLIRVELSKQIARVDTSIKEVYFKDQTLWSEQED